MGGALINSWSAPNNASGHALHLITYIVPVCNATVPAARVRQKGMMEKFHEILFKLNIDLNTNIFHIYKKIRNLSLTKFFFHYFAHKV